MLIFIRCSHVSKGEYGKIKELQEVACQAICDRIQGSVHSPLDITKTTKTFVSKPFMCEATKILAVICKFVIFNTFLEAV